MRMTTPSTLTPTAEASSKAHTHLSRGDSDPALPHPFKTLSHSSAAPDPRAARTPRPPQAAMPALPGLPSSRSSRADKAVCLSHQYIPPQQPMLPRRPLAEAQAEHPGALRPPGPGDAHGDRDLSGARMVKPPQKGSACRPHSPSTAPGSGRLPPPSAHPGGARSW